MFANLKVARDTQIPRIEMVAVVCVPAKVADAVGNRVRVAIGVESDEFRKGTAGLQRDDAAQCKLAKETIFGSGRGKVCYEAVAYVLVRVCPFERSVIEILRRADEGGEGAIVQGVREGIVGVQAEILAESFDHLKSEPVINRIAGVVCVI